MLKIIKPLFLLCTLCSVLFISGCLTVNHSERKQYILEVKNQPLHPTLASAISLDLHQTTAIPPFDQLSFLYRISNTQFATDYYHSFLISPTQQFTSILTNYLYASGYITPNPSIISEYKLYPKLTKLYADYRDRAQPKATVGMHILLIDKTASSPQILINKNFAIDIPLEEKTSESLMSAWNIGVEKLCKIETQAIIAAVNQDEKVKANLKKDENKEN